MSNNTVLYIVIGFVASCITLVLLKRENAARDRGERNEIIRGESPVPDDKYQGKKVYDSLEHVKSEKGDKWSGYRYTL